MPSARLRKCAMRSGARQHDALRADRIEAVLKPGSTASALNALRREAVDRLDAARAGFTADPNGARPASLRRAIRRRR